jgi:hypothetical protein
MIKSIVPLLAFAALLRHGTAQRSLHKMLFEVASRSMSTGSFFLTTLPEPNNPDLVMPHGRTSSYPHLEQRGYDG